MDGLGRPTKETDPANKASYTVYKDAAHEVRVYAGWDSAPELFLQASYTGREYEPLLGLYYYRARWYDPASGKFLIQDPLGLAAGDTNFSRYVFNSPTHHTDPSGEVVPFLAAWGIGMLVGGAIGYAETGTLAGTTMGALAGGIGGLFLGAGLLRFGVAGLYATGAIVGGAHGAVESYLVTGHWGHAIVGGALGSLFGLANPWGAIGAAVGSAGGYGLGYAVGGHATGVRYSQWGNLVGGLGGSIVGRGTMIGLELTGGIGGALAALLLEQDPLVGAQLGLLAGGISGGLLYPRGNPSALYSGTSRTVSGQLYQVNIGGRGFATVHKPGEWAWEGGWWSALVRYFYTGRRTPFKDDITITGDALKDYKPITAFGPFKLWKQLSGQYTRMKPGDFNFITGQQDYSRGTFTYLRHVWRFIRSESGAYLEWPAYFALAYLLWRVTERK